MVAASFADDYPMSKRSDEISEATMRAFGPEALNTFGNRIHRQTQPTDS